MWPFWFILYHNVRRCTRVAPAIRKKEERKFYHLLPVHGQAWNHKSRKRTHKLFKLSFFLQSSCYLFVKWSIILAVDSMVNATFQLTTRWQNYSWLKTAFLSIFEQGYQYTACELNCCNSKQWGLKNWQKA